MVGQFVSGNDVGDDEEEVDVDDDDDDYFDTKRVFARQTKSVTKKTSDTKSDADAKVVAENDADDSVAKIPSTELTPETIAALTGRTDFGEEEKCRSV